MDGKITNVTGLRPGQQLIESPQGLRIVTTSTPNRPVVKTESQKILSKVSSTTQDVEQKSPVVVRQHIRGNPANVIVKSVQSNKPTSTAPQILNSGQIVSSAGQQIQVANAQPTKIITSKRQLLQNNTPKVVRTSNLQQLLNQGGQKIVINQANTPNKIIIASTANNIVTNQSTTTATAQHTIVSNSTAQQVNMIFFKRIHSGS